MRILFVILVLASVASGASVIRQPQPQQPQPQQQPQSQQQQPQQQQQLLQMSLSNPYTNTTHAILLNLRQQLLTRAIKFDEHFRRLLTESKLSLHNMFMATYGMKYEHNTEIFATMYERLETYYITGNVELSKSLENFFQRLYQKIFQVANPNRAFPPAYLECVSEQLNHLKPFKDAPDKLIKDIKHTLVAARTLHQALNSAIDIIKSIISLGDLPQCTKLINEKLLRNKQQPFGFTTRDYLTGAAPSSRPCQEYCEQVILRCVNPGNLNPLDQHWKSFMLSLAELAKKLSVQYNIEISIVPIDLQISEAIMNFQDNAPNITQRVHALCGDAKPSISIPSGGAGLSSLPRGSSPHGQLGKREASPLARISPSSATGGSPNSQMAFPRRSSQTSGLGGAMNSNHRFNDGEYLMHQNGKNPYDQVRPPHSGDSQYSPPDPFYGHQPNRRPPVIISEIKDYLLSIKSFWSNLPSSVCNATLSASYGLTPNPAVSWRRGGASSTGANVGSLNSQQNCFQETLSVTDLNLDLRYRNEIQLQIKRLDSMQSKINDALHGVEIDWSKSSEPVSALNQALMPSSDGSSSEGPISSAQLDQNQRQRPPQQPLVPPSAYDPNQSSSSIDDEFLEEPGSDEDCEGSGDGDWSEGSMDDECPKYDPTEDPLEGSTEEEEGAIPSESSSTVPPVSEPPIELIEPPGNTIDDPANDNLIKPKSAASPSGLLIVIESASLLPVSIICCTLSLVIQYVTLPRAIR